MRKVRELGVILGDEYSPGCASWPFTCAAADPDEEQTLPPESIRALREELQERIAAS